eukprot:GHVU01050080.1.p1 GENE.GHVU01050080.1~~GHVU01050080.1.p1  ORF type:complete len:173 (+),score=26.33 GHVU01050080.1:1200-1718(+)
MSMSGACSRWEDHFPPDLIETARPLVGLAAPLELQELLRSALLDCGRRAATSSHESNAAAGAPTGMPAAEGGSAGTGGASQTAASVPPERMRIRVGDFSCFESLLLLEEEKKRSNENHSGGGGGGSGWPRGGGPVMMPVSESPSSASRTRMSAHPYTHSLTHTLTDTHPLTH